MVHDRLPASALIVAALAFLLTPPVNAQAPPFRFYDTERHDLASRILGQTLRITVQLPIRLRDESERFPALYITDSNPGPRFEETNLWMQWGGDVPRFIAVDIGHPTWAEWQLRQRNFTPTDTGPIPGYGQGLVDLGPIALEGVRGGGAADFLRFLREELKPFIDGKYPTLPTEDGYFGHSAGGRFGAFVLLHQPETFTRYVLSSPELSWDDAVLLRQAAQFAASNRAVKARLFMSAGGRENPTMAANMYRMQALLSRVEGLEIETHLFPEESHASVHPMGYIRGIRWAYGKPPVHFLEAYRKAHPAPDPPQTGAGDRPAAGSSR